ncbi:MAG TPA: stage 0 sporulation family protein [Candidatus Omnitrophota bacterium]|nr:stage 0 sporulation family protein [Candidatus Omnitrophota bacterium]
MAQIIQVKLGEYRPVAFFNIEDQVKCARGDMVVLQIDRGFEFGVVISDINVPCKTKPEELSGNVMRLASAEDLKTVEANRKKAEEAMASCIRKVQERKIDMQIAQCEYTFDATKVVFYFTAEGRIDFRELVKDLARIFKVRIELKQIGVRDKAKIIGGYGVCGRELCCSSYMKGFHPLSIKMAKDQGLQLNPSRISGVCGRIKCCMAYEFIVYKEYARDLPKVGEKINTPEGKGKVVDINILKRVVSVDLGEGKFIKQSFAKAEVRV